MTSKNVKHANTFFTMRKYGTFQKCPHFHWTPINHQLNHHIYAAHLKILPTIRAKRIIWTHSLIVKKKSQMKENAPSVKTNRCHRRSINLGKWSCTINWDKLVKVWMKEIAKKKTIYLKLDFEMFNHRLAACLLWHGQKVETSRKNDVSNESDWHIKIAMWKENFQMMCVCECSMFWYLN